jgi:serine/threonine protein kinase
MALAKITEILCLFHEAKKIHGDVKPSNLALRSESPDSCVPIDFGSVSSTGPYEVTVSPTLGTSSYSPVNLTQTVYEREKHDIFAAAAIFYDILYTWPNPIKEGCLCKEVAEFSQKSPNQFLAGWNPRILADFITTRSNLPASLKPIFLSALAGEGTTYTMLHLHADLQALHRSIESRKISIGTPRDSESSYELSDPMDDDEIEEQIYESNTADVIPIFQTRYEFAEEIPEEIEGES